MHVSCSFLQCFSHCDSHFSSFWPNYVTMSIPFSGSFTRSAGIASARAKEIKALNLKACKRITVTFDPFHEKSAATSTLDQGNWYSPTPLSTKSLFRVLLEFPKIFPFIPFIWIGGRSEKDMIACRLGGGPDPGGCSLDITQRLAGFWEFMYFLSFPKVALTNANCNVKPDIVCNRAPPKINFQLIPTIQEQSKLKNIVFNCENLSSLEILQQFNKHVSALAPKGEDLSGGPKTKLEKKASRKK